MAKTRIKPERPIYPTPAALITSVDETGNPNIITLAEVFNISISKPVIIGIAIRKVTYSHSLISKTGEFVVNMPTVDIIDKVMVCGEVSGRRVDKFKKTGLTPLPAVRVSPPLIAECLINLECKVLGIQEIGDHDLFLGEVLVQHVEEEILDKDRKINFRKLNGFAFNLGEFWTFGERITLY